MVMSRIAGRYELQEKLGEGGMGVVWRALDVKTGAEVAIKLMKDISDPLAVELFTKEWRALAAISHPNIVEVRDVDVIEENRQRKPFFVMPLLRGSTLADLIADASARLTMERIVEITSHVCRGLQAAHQRGLVHRDLKPSNIFVMDDDTAKIIDFGVVHLSGSKSVTGQKGTFQYMSPEQAQLQPITPASDLFSMGVILYEALTLRRPFARKTPDETMEAVIKHIPPSVSEINPSINQQVSKIVHKCLAKKPIHRFASARELAETLQKAARNETVFDSTKIGPRIERAKNAFKNGDDGFASEILAELEAEGNLDPRITVLRGQIDVAVKQKKVRSLLENVWTRMEQEEIPLAMDKIREVLELDPQNAEARAMLETIEKQRSKTQVAKWLDIAQTHLSNRDFGAARNAVQEVLALRPGDPRALDLLEKIESTETDARRIRDQKEQLYSSALRAYQNGEIESALDKLERLLSVAQANPNAAIPERDAVYQSFYKEVRSESDYIHGALEYAQRQFSEKNFAGAMAVCHELLKRYPNDGTFQALKIRVEDAERQELSSYIAEVSKRLDAEPDLDRRVNIAKEASQRYPNETHFAQQLKLIRERRDLVNAIVAKARLFEERGQYAEAITQWDILRNIHPQYPGIAFELEQCKKKRNRQAREEEHSRIIEVINGLMENRAYAKARECADAALVDFPGDTELSGMRTLAEQALERAKESRRLFEEGQHAVGEKDLVRATGLLRNSFNLDPRGPGVRDALVYVLAERGRTLADENWRKAEPLCQEASELDANHPAVRELHSTITEAKRAAMVGQCLAESRNLAATGKVRDALELVQQVRKDYPRDSRLEQQEASLQREVNEATRREERGKDRAVLIENRRLAELNPDRTKLQALLEQSYLIREKHPDDADIAQSVAELEHSVRRVAKVEDLTELLRVNTLTGTDGRTTVARKTIRAQGAKRTEERKGPKLVGKNGEKTRLFEPSNGKGKASRLRPVLLATEVFAADATAFAKKMVADAVRFARPAGKWPPARLGTVGAVVVLLVAGAYSVFHRPSPTKPSDQNVVSVRSVQITAEPSDSTIMSDGKPISDGMVAIGTTIAISHPGYKTKSVKIEREEDGKIALEPEPVHLSIHTSEPAGTVILDGNKIGDLEDGSFDGEIAVDGNTHKLSLTQQGQTLFAVEVQLPVAGQPRVTPLKAGDLFAISSLANHATVYASNELKDARMGDQAIAVTSSGTDIPLSDQNHEFAFATGSGQRSVVIDLSNAPALLVQSLNAEPQVEVTANVETAKLTVNGVAVPHRRHRWIVSRPPGTYKLEMSAEGYVTQTWDVTLKRGQTLKKPFELPPVPKVPTVAALVIRNATPAAYVELDGNLVGTVDSNGNLTLPKALTEGRHRVKLSKPGFEPWSEEFPVRPPNELTINVRLSPSTATLAFETDVKNVTVKIRRSGEGFKEVKATDGLQVPPGSYEIVATAPWYKESRIQETLEAGNHTVSLKLVPDSEYGFQDPNDVTREGQWFRAKSSGKFVPLKAGVLRVNLIFAKQGKTLLWDKKLEWLIEVPSQPLEIRYVLEGHKLNRKGTLRDDPLEPKETKVDAQARGQKELISVHIKVDGARIQVTNDEGSTLDEFTAPRDLANGRIGLKTDSLFMVRSDTQ